MSKNCSFKSKEFHTENESESMAINQCTLYFLTHTHTHTHTRRIKRPRGQCCLAVFSGRSTLIKSIDCCHRPSVGWSLIKAHAEEEVKGHWIIITPTPLIKPYCS